MSRVVVLGAGVGGLATALAFGRAGHDVVVLERDATPLPADPHAAFTWDRRGAPQVRHSHAFLARLRNLLRDRYPDVLADLLAAGATEIDFPTMLPANMADRARRPGDDDLVALACRRTTFEWVLRRTALACPTVRLIDGATASGLVGTPATADRPARVTGVTTTGPETGPGPSTVSADLVVAATGRGAPLPAWLDALGVVVEEIAADTGIIYLSRFYRLRDDATVPVQEGPIGGDLGYLKYAVFQGDNRIFSVTFAVHTDDGELRTALRDPETFDRAARHLPATAAWAAAGLADPITEVEVMARLLNRRRRFTTDDGRPLVLGFAAVGDAHTCTNPLYGRGCSLAVVQADLLVDAWGAHVDQPGSGGGPAGDLAAAGAAYEAASVECVEPWYHASVASDRQAAKAAERDRRARRGEDTAELDADPDTNAADLLRHGLMPAVRTDPEVFRAFLRAFNLLTPPQALMGEPALVARVLETYQERDRRPPEEPLGPPRAEMIAALGGPATI
jgi:2-polyprenyl-6-methoxyphenol hydroxylase-like FAD-dependent oxidoreductase